MICSFCFSLFLFPPKPILDRDIRQSRTCARLEKAITRVYENHLVMSTIIFSVFVSLYKSCISYCIENCALICVFKQIHRLSARNNSASAQNSAVFCVHHVKQLTICTSRGPRKNFFIHLNRKWGKKIPSKSAASSAELRFPVLPRDSLKLLWGTTSVGNSCFSDRSTVR